LEIPEGKTCDESSTVYLDCYDTNWESTNDSSRNYCQMWGNNRGLCTHINESGQIIDYTTMKLTSREDAVCNSNDICIDYKKFKKRNCPDESDCKSKWTKYNPGEFKDCSFSRGTQICENTDKTQKRDCHQINAEYWECFTHLI